MVGGGVGSQEAGAGVPLQEAGSNRSGGDAVGPGVGEGSVPAVRSKGGRCRVPAVAYFGAREEGAGCAGTLGEESLQCP